MLGWGGGYQKPQHLQAKKYLLTISKLLDRITKFES